MYIVQFYFRRQNKVSSLPCLAHKCLPFVQAELVERTSNVTVNGTELAVTELAYETTALRRDPNYIRWPRQ